jgi:DNA-binding NarL/FixJ family response regulator
MSKTKIGIIDDHQAIGQGLASELQKTGEFEVLFTVSEKEQILVTLTTQQPDVLLMDVVMPGTLGIETFKEVLATFPGSKIIAYTALNSPVMIELLLRTGVMGYVSKQHDFNNLREAISDVMYDRIYLPEDYRFILKKIKNKEGPEELSKREIEILTLIAEEKKTNDIAELLGISVNTVETHRRHLFDKLNVSNLAGLIKTGFDLGYLK